MKLKYKLETKFTPPKVNAIHKFKIGSIAEVIEYTGYASVQKTDTVRIIANDGMCLLCKVTKGKRKDKELWLLPNDLKIIKEG